MGNFSLGLSFVCILGFWTTLVTSDSIDDNFLECLTLRNLSIPIPTYSPNDSSYSVIFNSSARNLRFLSPNLLKPRFVITPLHETHFQAIVICCKRHGLDLNVRSGGHDVEGLSYVSDSPFVIADLINYRNITINIQEKSAWIQGGAQLGEVFYRIAEKSNILGFPAGFTPTVGVGGHISGGGMGSLVRKYGLSCDQVIDARMVDANGNILDRQSMGTDLFWAIRGGGASSFGVILAWKVNLVPVTPNVTVSIVHRTLEQNATSLVYKWQNVVDKVHEDLYISLSISVVNASQNSGKTVQVSFWIMYLGGTDELLQLMAENFAELGLGRNDCVEMRWVESQIYFAAPGSPLEILLNRDPVLKIFLKAKSDYVKEPISMAGLEGIWSTFMEAEAPTFMFWAPFGGKMNEISEYETPYPHRAGNIYNILYVASWLNESDSNQKIDGIRRFYQCMGQYVSKLPRTAYLNYHDLDLGENKDGIFNYLTARSWGTKYFKTNFDRLVYVKTKVDPKNFFRNRQSIPPYL